MFYVLGLKNDFYKAFRFKNNQFPIEVSKEDRFSRLIQIPFASKTNAALKVEFRNFSKYC
jgi:hypothetical protein